MATPTFNRYRNAARKATLLGVPFRFGVGLTLNEIRRAQELGGTEEAYQQVQQSKNLKWATTTVQRVGTILPLPYEGQPAAEYAEDMTDLLAAHVARVRESGGDKLAEVLVQKIALMLPSLMVKTQ